MTNHYKFVSLDLYAECIEPLDSDTHAEMAPEKDPLIYQHASQWTTIYPGSPSDLL